MRAGSSEACCKPAAWDPHWAAPPLAAPQRFPQTLHNLKHTTQQDAVAAGLDPELGSPSTRKPKTAILNFVR